MNTTMILIAFLVAVAAIAWFLRGRSGTAAVSRQTANATVRTKRKVIVEERTKYLVAFDLDNGDSESLDVDPSIFDRVREGQRGTLVYEETRCLSFEPERA
ncbi:MAG: DUF2500 family protein [Deltaproteobacteria bacterium]|nr:DUF2500 family protein [Deltaproteobacteria bacterium]